ncbi:MAG: XdhC/CoxI family protein, partial [Acidobacteriota bacterium]
KMAVGADSCLMGSIGGGVMEVNLVEESRRLLSVPPAVAGGFRDQVHRKNVSDSSGMICSGKQTVIFKLLTPADLIVVEWIIEGRRKSESIEVEITAEEFAAGPAKNPPATAGGTDFATTAASFRYTERLGFKNALYIIGGGHCALALSELMSKMDFHISLFDDRPELNTIEKNRFAHEIKVIDAYENISDYVPSSARSYIVVMTLGYKSDGQVIRSLIDKDFKYFGVLGSSAKMSAMFIEFIKEGIPAEKLDRIRTPVGIAINSRTPEEIAVSIAAEIISVKNSE